MEHETTQVVSVVAANVKSGKEITSITSITSGDILMATMTAKEFFKSGWLKERETISR